MSGSSNGASIHWSTLGGQITSSSTNTVIFVVTSGMALHICLRLFASRMLKTRIFLALTEFAILARSSTLTSTVTSMSSRGSVRRQVRNVVTSSSPPAAIVGRMIVTSFGEYVGYSGIGIGRKVQWETLFTM
ncbi:hypothetical protein LTR74_018998, partial [Friedmanniomyces endolithicus]